MAAPVEAVVAYEPGANITCLAGAAITAGRFVKISATKAVGAPVTVIHDTAGVAAFGVAMYSAASGELVSVKPLNAGGVVGVTVGTGGVTFGQEVESDGTGQAVAFSSGKICGMTLTTTAATGTALIAIGR
jgi:hypothetical protein